MVKSQEVTDEEQEKLQHLWDCFFSHHVFGKKHLRINIDRRNHQGEPPNKMCSHAEGTTAMISAFK